MDQFQFVENAVLRAAIIPPLSAHNMGQDAANKLVTLVGSALFPEDPMYANIP